MNSKVFEKLFPTFFSVCIILGLSAGASAQDCWDYSTYLRWASEVDTPGSALAIAAKGQYLYVADGLGGLQVVSIIDPAEPAVVHTVDAAADARDVVISGDHVFVASGNSGLQVVNISNPTSAFIEGSANTEGSASGVFIHQDIALVAVEDFGLQIFDITDVTTPQLIRNVETPGMAYGVSASPYFAYVADGPMGIQIIDILDPATAELAAVVNTPGNARDLVSRGRYWFVADSGQGVTVLARTPQYFPMAYWQFNGDGDDQTQRHPATLAGNARYQEIFTLTDSSNWGLFTEDNTSYAEYAPPVGEIFVGRISFKFKLDASFAADPSFIGSLDIITSDRPGFNLGDCRVALDPADGKMVFSQDDPDSGAPNELRTTLDTWDMDVFYSVEIDWDEWGREIQVRWSIDNETFFDSQIDGFVSPCFSGDAVETLIGSRKEDSLLLGLTIDWLKIDDSLVAGQIETTIPLEGYAQDLVFQEDHAFVTLEHGDLHVIDFSQPSSPIVVGTVDTPNHSRGVAVTADHAFVADKDAGVQVISFSTPRSPEPLGVLNTLGSSYGVAAAGNTVYVADRDRGLQIVDITLPASPQFLAQVETAGNAVDVAVAGSHAYVAEAVFSDYSDKSISPSLFANAVFPKANSTAIAGHISEKAGRYSSLQIIDVSVPSMPVVTGTVETPGFALDVEVVGSFSYVADFTAFLVIDTSDPAAPTIVGSLETPGRARDLAISGNHAFVADIAGLQVIDISTPSAPQLVGSLSTPGAAYGVAVSGNTAYVADVDFGLHVVDVTNPGSPLLSGTAYTPGGAYDVEVIGNFAYVSDGFDTVFSSLRIVDISVPGNPHLVGDFDTPGSVYSVALEGDNAFVTDGGKGLQILRRQCDPGFLMTPGLSIDGQDMRIQSDEGPVEIAEGLNISIGIEVKNEGDRSASGQVVFEFEDDAGERQPIRTALVHTARKGASGCDAFVEIPWTVQDANTVIHVSLRNIEPLDGNPSDNHAQRALGEHTLVVYPSEFSITKDPEGVTFAWKPAPVGGTESFRLVGTSGESEWEIPFEYDGAGSFSASDMVGSEYIGEFVVYSLYYLEPDTEWVLIATEKVFFETPRISTRLQGAHPNPFNPMTTISFSVEKPQWVKIMVFDIAGRLVSVLVDQVHEAGYFTVDWTGRDSKSQNISSGVYFLRMETATGSEVRKLTLVR
jgi:hypothetical protein